MEEDQVRQRQGHYSSEVSLHRANRLFATVAVLCILGYVIVASLDRLRYTEFTQGNYLIFHIIAEMMSIIVSFAVFVVGWYGYKQNKSRQDLFIGIVFLTVGLLDFVHTLSYPGMPDFLSPSSASKASTYWVMARMVNSLGLIAAAYVTVNTGGKWFTPWKLAAISIFIVVTATSIVSYQPHLLPAMYVEGVGQTGAKLLLGWTVIFFYGIAVYAFGDTGGREKSTILLQLGLIVSIFSELGFTLYRSAFDSFNMMGHIYKVAAYYLIFRALFVSSFQRPYYELVQARNQIEQSFSRIGLALASSLKLNEVLDLIAELASDMLKSGHAVVMLMRDGELHIQPRGGMQMPQGKVSMEHSSVGLSVVRRKPVYIPDVNALPGHTDECHCQHLPGMKARSTVSAPIIAGEDILGVVEVCSPRVGAFGQREAELLSTFARHAAVAIRNSIAYERERAVADSLQSSLLPPAPQIPGLDIAVRYVPAEDTAKVGGDLYDIYPLDDDHLAIIIGDVCGHGLEAASVMAMTVHMMRGFLSQGAAPGEALGQVNQALCRSDIVEKHPTFVTLLISVLNMRTREFRYANAGHHMPVILSNDGCRIMELESGLPLAVDESSSYETITVSLESVSGVLLYTDGVVEARHQGKFFGDEKLFEQCDLMLNCSSELILDGIIQEVRTWSGMLQDDVAVLAVKWEE